jgi:hypothetical protein
LHARHRTERTPVPVPQPEDVESFLSRIMLQVSGGMPPASLSGWSQSLGSWNRNTPSDAPLRPRPACLAGTRAWKAGVNRRSLAHQTCRPAG